MKRIVVLAAVLIAISTVSVNAAATTVPESVYADSIAPYYETAFDAAYYGGTNSNNVNKDTTINPVTLFPQISFD